MFTTYFSEIAIENGAGDILAIDRLKVDGRTFQARRPGTSGSFAAQGTMLIACLDVVPRTIADAIQKAGLDLDEAAIGVSQLPKSTGMIVRVLAADGAALKRTMLMVWCAVRVALKGKLPIERRK